MFHKLFTNSYLLESESETWNVVEILNLFVCATQWWPSHNGSVLISTSQKSNEISTADIAVIRKKLENFSKLVYIFLIFKETKIFLFNFVFDLYRRNTKTKSIFSIYK